MASIKDLKKEIQFLTQELMNECFTYRLVNAGKDEEKVIEVMGKIISMKDSLISEVNAAKNADPSKAKALYASINKKIEKEFVALTEKLNK